ncbi:MAG: acetate--CoA ligase [Aigarchaeota archaeon]|nr:acetate--CoA ligase [Aigarchaeota archaeon]MDW8092233.1 acetate--CoA ligase [Nitrososphaerota archaeon]
MSTDTSLREPLPYEERIILDKWADRSCTLEQYRRLHSECTSNPEEHWARVAREIDWFKSFERVMEPGDHPNVYRWFPGGKINFSYLCLDRHVRTRNRNKVAIVWEGEPVDDRGQPLEKRVLSYYDLWRDVNRAAYLMSRKLRLKKGDAVAYYMPMVPELPALMLAAARLGVIFTQVFSGFSAEALATRVNDVGARYIFTTDGYYRRGSVIRTKDIVDKAVKDCPDVEGVVITRRLGLKDMTVDHERDMSYDVLLREVPANAYVEPEHLDSSDILYVLYTSGTTGKPKGIIHDNGGYAVILHATMKWVFDIRDEDLFWCTADIGWVTGHSYVVFGPLMVGASIVMYEGAPDYPEPDRWWSIIERYGVTIFYTSPTAVRALMRVSHDYVRRHDLSSLRLIHSVGEPINPSAWRWLFETIGGGRCPVGSTWWMTETGGILISHTPGLCLIPLKPGTNGWPLPGIEVEVVDDKGRPVKDGERGYLIIKRPWPGMLGPPTGMWREPERYSETYFSRFGYFFTGDYAIRDSDGYIWVLGRADEVLKVAGHRIGTYEIESALVSHPSVAEAAVVGIPDEVKGEVPIAYVVLRVGATAGSNMENELKEWIREKMGPISVPKNVFVVNKLPKTRSGKIMRRVIRAVATGMLIGDVTTLEDQAAVEEVKAAYEEMLKDLAKNE